MQDERFFPKLDQVVSEGGHKLQGDKRVICLKQSLSETGLVDYGFSDSEDSDEERNAITDINGNKMDKDFFAGKKRKVFEDSVTGSVCSKRLCYKDLKKKCETLKSKATDIRTGDSVNSNKSINNNWMLDVSEIPLPTSGKPISITNSNKDKQYKTPISKNVKSSQLRSVLGRRSPLCHFSEKGARSKQKRSISGVQQQNDSESITSPKTCVASLITVPQHSVSVAAVSNQEVSKSLIPPESMSSTAAYPNQTLSISGKDHKSPHESASSSYVPFWANKSPQSQLNSPLYGCHTLNRCHNKLSQDLPLTSTPQHVILSYACKTNTPQKSPVPVSLSNTHKTPSKTTDTEISDNSLYLSPSQMFMPSPLVSPHQRFLQNSYLINKSASPSPTSKTDWKKRFKESSESYGVKYIDSHCHLDFLFHRQLYKGSWEKYRSLNCDTFPETFEGCVAVFCAPSSFQPNGLWRDLAASDGVWMTFGCHPKNATEFTQAAEAGLYHCLSHSKVVALGEIGLDYSGTFRQHEEIQKTVFQKQIQIALDMKKPLVIHCRDADEDCFNILSEMVPKNHKIHCHCFAGDYAMAKKWLDTFPNLFIGMTPLVTFRGAAPTHNVARFIPLERLLLETDAPYFVPRKVPKDEMTYSHPGMAITVAEQVAYIKGCSVQEVLIACRQNTKEMYGI